MGTTLAVKQNEVLDDRNVAIIRAAHQIEVTTDREYQEASEFLRACKNLETKVKGYFAPLVKAAHTAWKAAKDRENQALEPIGAALNSLGKTMGRYQAECERQRQIEAAAIRAAEEAEAREAREKYAKRLQDAGLAEEAKATREAPLMVPVPKPEEPMKVAGTAVRTSWTFEVVDAAAVPREYLMPDEKKIGGVVRAMKDATNIPGVRVYAETKVHARS